jgi:putative membrane protein insertion efficiency factor
VTGEARWLLPRRVLVLMLRGYQLTVSPWLGPACRFEPTCSRYAAEAVDHHGALRGGWLALQRLVRCHPWGGCGYDPVP